MPTVPKRFGFGLSPAPRPNPTPWRSVQLAPPQFGIFAAAPAPKPFSIVDIFTRLAATAHTAAPTVAPAGLLLAPGPAVLPAVTVPPPVAAPLASPVPPIVGVPLAARAVRRPSKTLIGG